MVQPCGLGTGMLATGLPMGVEPARCPLGHQLQPDPLRTTEFAPALSEANQQQPPAAGYGKPTGATAFKAGRFSGQDFALQPDGTLRCPANQKLTAHESRREADGSLRVVYGASIRQCRSWPDATSSASGTAAPPRSRAR